MRYASTGLLILIILLITAEPRFACTCYGPEGVEGNFKAADAVFLGRVKDLQLDRENINALFEVEKSWKGVDTKEVLVQSPANTCGWRFQEEESYVVYGYDRESGGFTTNVCFRLRRIADASEDLAYLQTQALIALKQPLPIYWKFLIGVMVCIFLLAGSIILLRKVGRKVA